MNVEKLTELSLLEKEEKHHISVPRGERSNVVIEPKLSHQWYEKTSEMAARANEAIKTFLAKKQEKDQEKARIRKLLKNMKKYENLKNCKKSEGINLIFKKIK